MSGLRSLGGRWLTAYLAGAVLVALIVLALTRPVPYVTFRPGPVQNTLGEFKGQQIVQISGRQTYPADGTLDLTTVQVTRPDASISLAQAVRAWIDSDDAVLPRDVVYPPDESAEEAAEQSTAEMVHSQHAAAVAALRELGYDITFQVMVADVIAGAPAKGHLKAGDQILAVGGTKVAEAEQVSKLLQDVQPGDTARLTVRRDGAERTVDTPTEKAPDGRTVVGVHVSNDPVLPFEVNISVGDAIGGPSAGTMFSLAVIDKLTPGDLTGGRHFAGTGEIDIDGTVGPIGGIQQKIAGAAGAGAKFFLVPAQNCAEAAGASAADQVQLVRISTLHQARTAVEKLADDPDAKVPSCSTGAAG